MLEWRPLQWIGKRSYGLYLWHVPIFYLVDSMHLPGGHLRFERNVLAVVATFVVSAASYRIIEYPILQRKRRFARVDTGLATL